MSPEGYASDREWLAERFESLTTRVVALKPSEWAEKHRYLPQAATPKPGFYRFRVTPYLREILDCLGIDSPVREVALMKGVQIGATVGILENALGYLISHVKKSPAMLLTADAELAKIRLNSSILPMLRHSGLDGLIQSSDTRNSRKTGQTEQMLEWVGGGFCLLFGAKNADKMRSVPIEDLLRDECDAYPMVVGRDGDPMKLSADRTAAYESTRKILDISTPTIRGQSRIHERFLRGDQRRYFVRCLKCNAPQTLRWERTNKDTGEVTGIHWETLEGNIVPDSVRYLCKECGHPHTNEDKTRLLAPEHGAEWRPTAVPVDPTCRSYHLSALYSPPGMQSWATAAAKWTEAWDRERGQPRDVAKLQVFYNNQLGEPFRMTGSSVRFEAVSSHRRAEYHFGQIPNRWAEKFCGSVVLLVVCTVDVHADNLAVSVIGWCRDKRSILIDYTRFKGNTERLDDADTWGRLRTLIETKVYVADDGKTYPIQLTLIDSGYRADDVYTFCSEYASAVFPVKGRDATQAANLREFSEFKTPNGQVGYGVTVDFYKDRLSSALRRSWDGVSLQPPGHFNAPLDATDKQLKELTVETKREKVDNKTGQRLGFFWHRPSGADNELWDCLVYGSAGLDLIAHDVCVKQLERESVNWHEFFSILETQRPFFTEPTKDGGR